MDFLQRAYSQAADLFQSMTLGARITAGLLLAVVVLSLVYLFHHQTGGTDEYLFGGQAFSQRELGTMEAAFAKATLNQSEIVGNRMRVPRGQKELYLAALADDNALPENFDTEFEKMIDSESPFVSKQLREMRLKHANQKKLARIISRMQGIEEASDQYDEVKTPGLPPRIEKRAIVAVRAMGNHSLDEERIRAIRATVTGFIGGLQRDNVTVTDLNTGRAYPGTGDDSLPGGADNVYASNKKVYEKYWRDTIYQRLAMYPGIVVGVNVELDPELNHQSQRTSYDTEPVPVHLSESRKESSSSPVESGAQPGFVPNVGNTPQAVNNSAASRSESSESRAEQRSLTGQTQVTTHKAPLLPTRVTASIGMPNSYFVKVWHQLNPSTDGEEPREPTVEQLKQIEEEIRGTVESAVLSLLPPLPQANNPLPQVTVTSYQDLGTPALPEDTVADATLAWLTGNWQTLALLGIGLVSLLMLRNMVRTALTAPPAPAGQAAGQSAAENAAATNEMPAAGEGDEPESAPHILKGRFPAAGPSLRDELTNLVKEDPDAAANVLKNWIGDAA